MAIDPNTMQRLQQMFGSAGSLAGGLYDVTSEYGGDLLTGLGVIGGGLAAGTKAQLTGADPQEAITQQYEAQKQQAADNLSTTTTKPQGVFPYEPQEGPPPSLMTPPQQQRGGRPRVPGGRPRRGFGSLDTAMSEYAKAGQDYGAYLQEQVTRQEEAFNSIREVHSRFVQSQKNIEARRAEAEGRALQSYDDARLEARYAGLGDAKEIKHLQQVAANADGSYSEQQVQAASNQLQKAQGVDPGRYWANQKGWAKALAVYAVSLGARAQAMGAGPNPALNMIQKEIDRDIAAQQSMFQNKRMASADAQNYYSMVARKFDREEDRMLAARTMALEDAALKLDEMKMVAGTVEKQTALQQDAAKLRMGAEEMKMKLAEQRAQHREMMDLKRAELSMKMAGSKGGKQLAAGQVNRLTDAKDAVTKIRGLKQLWSQLGTAAPVMQYVPGQAAYKYKKEMNIFHRWFAKQIEKSRISDQDAEHYKNSMPGMWTWSQGGADFFDFLEKAVVDQLQTDMEGMGLAGYDVSGFADFVDVPPTIGDVNAPATPLNE